MGFKGCQSGINASKIFLDFWNCREIIESSTSNSRGRNDMKTLNDEGMKLGVTRGGVDWGWCHLEPIFMLSSWLLIHHPYLLWLLMLIVVKPILRLSSLHVLFYHNFSRISYL